jgi:alpha-1,3-mannosyltransferase
MEEVVRSLVQHQLTRTSHQPHVITLDRVFHEAKRTLPAHETIEGVPVSRLSYTGSQRYPICPRVLSALGEADVIHVHGIDFFFDFLAITRPLHGKPLLASTHGGFFHTDFAQRLKKLYFSSVTRASGMCYDRIIATSENDGAIFERIISGAKLAVIENGVDVEKYQAAAAAQLTPTLIYFGRWSVNKGLLDALNVFAALRRQSPATIDWQFIIAGREFDMDADDIRRRAQQAGVLDSVSIIASPSAEQLRAHINCASYFICLSRHEGFGIAPIEAMSAGLRVVLSDIPPFRRLARNAPSSVLLATPDANTCAAQIQSLHARGQQDYEAMQRASRRAAAAYSWEGVATQYLRQYETLLSH